MKKLTCCIAYFIMSIIFSTQADAGIIKTIYSGNNFSAGDTIVVDVGVGAIADLYAFQFDLNFDPTLLAPTTSAEGTFLSSAGPTFFIGGTPDTTTGLISNVAGTLVGPTTGVDGPGILASFIFMALADGSPIFTTSNELLLDSNLLVINGSSSAIPEPSTILLLLFGFTTMLACSRPAQQVLPIVTHNPFKSVGRKINKMFLVAFVLFLPLISNAQTAPFTQCPPVGLAASCRILIVIDANGGLRVLTDTNASPTYDGSDDTLIGVINLSPNKVSSIPLRGAGIIFGFDGDGICEGFRPGPSGCPFGPTKYEGPGVTFSNISADSSSGVVNFNPPIPAKGGSRYFGLELAIVTQCTSTTPPPTLKQDDVRWASVRLGPKTSTTTIGKFGCALTDLAMEINFYAQKQGKSFRTDPVLLNDYLVKNNAFTADPLALISTSKVPLVAKYARLNGVNFYYQGIVDHRDDFTLDQYLCNGQVPMLLVGSPHWVVATGQTVDQGVQTYSDIDPDSWPNGNTIKGGWGNNYKAMALFSDTRSPLSGLYVTAHSPVELMITAPDGTQTGFDPIKNVRLSSVPLSSYMINQLADDETHGQPLTPELKELGIPGATSGKYNLQIFGTGNGPYTLDFTYYDQNATMNTKSISGIAIPGLKTNVAIQYSDVVGIDTVVTAYCPGDVNNDGIVDSSDYSLVRNSFGLTKGSKQYNAGADINNDGKVDIVDLAFVAKNFGCKTTIK